ncbi:MAG TPA: methylated-DNA--[protein]-cysteine S-methyltransferase [Acidimicrobiales bacterium]|nr:methylated-DNA--[protein]-cysteine S-methyltransferase [Acidimicrobiales bacterium]
MNDILTSTVESPIGPLTLIARDGVLTHLSMHEARHATAPPDDAMIDDAWFKDVASQLEAYFTGKLMTFDLEMNMIGTVFQRGVWAQLSAIPYGETISYGELAGRVGNPNASRAVGLANGRNPIAIIVPCHRVIGADGSLTGYGGGLQRKTWLLDHEKQHRP